jgi:LacI family transcriptional regulator
LKQNFGSVTIDDVAALAGVSIKTVSRVLNREPHVRPVMRDKVLSAVQTLNYKPNFAARALAGSRAYLLGLYYDNPSPGYISGVQFGAMSACREAGYHLLVEQLDGESLGSLGLVEAMLSTVKTDGLILSPPVCDRSELLDILDSRRIPYVRIAPAGQFDRGPYVYMDDQRAAYEVTVHLQKLGHRRIGFIKGHAEHSATPLRYRGFRQAMEDAGMDIHPQWVQSGNFSFRSGVGAAERLLNLSDRPTAIFASNDDMALGVMAVANRMQLTLPKELSVAGFDDSPIAQVVWPQLTTIRQPVEKMAFEAASMLINGPRQSGEAKGRLLDFELVVRDSTAPASG